jgi:transposase
VTLQLLWSEYQESVAARGDGSKPYQYSQFCELYCAWRVRLKPSMRRVHRAGEKAFVDYSGKKPRLTDPRTGEVQEVDLFVMVLGASNYTYAEALRSQSLPDFVGATIRGFEFFGGVPEVIVPDQQGVSYMSAQRTRPKQRESSAARSAPASGRGWAAVNGARQSYDLGSASSYVKTDRVPRMDVAC